MTDIPLPPPAPGTLSARILALASEGIPSVEIQKRLNLTQVSVVHTICKRYGAEFKKSGHKNTLRRSGELVVGWNKKTGHRFIHVPGSVLRVIGAEGDVAVSFEVFGDKIVLTRKPENPEESIGGAL